MGNEQRGAKIRPKLETNTNGKRHIAGRYCPFSRNGQGFCEQHRKWKDESHACDDCEARKGTRC